MRFLVDADTFALLRPEDVALPFLWAKDIALPFLRLEDVALLFLRPEDVALPFLRPDPLLADAFRPSAILSDSKDYFLSNPTAAIPHISSPAPKTNVYGSLEAHQPPRPP